ncbi:hypothetical protein BST27_21885 [Mycobacterium intermedium]|uniref:Uncharacterized protein n=1 Tax=Mycobacterium intermedium TaxID=28445 RepID=A0A1E3S727_MYCIE|nr:hypothetical protein [Mycobacterium intermedium]MCV6967960.1 hypothetical protein [Mycobacterium intermedium]ODQ97910.1 hypothetical protein BHQ20_24680 [Mycobacterium intermedium]OPE48719.1 hypothetical protein BV508_17005 [Mycobacterium intermedium]ORA97808.1 hypothetical protein BST27_21885 [Mycobacterium intermedium]
MSVKSVSRRVWRGEQKVLRLQRRLWILQLAFWPALITGSALIGVAAFRRWQRQPDSAPASAPGEPNPLP